MTYITPNHLGGHMNKTHIDAGSIKFLLSLYPLKYMLDIGCGPAGMADIAKANGLYYQGIDGDQSLIHDRILYHDFTKGSGPAFPYKGEFDLVWSTEFLEHLEEKYLPNVLPLFNSKCVSVITHALPGETGGHHHVNLQTADYWIDKFESNTDLKYSPDLTNRIREASSMAKGFMKKSGLVFISSNQAR